MIELKRCVVKPFDKDKFELYEDFIVNLGVEEKKIILSIPKGFKTNGADIPRLFWSFYPPYRSEYFSAVILHDFLCEKARTRKDYKEADLCFKVALKALNVNKFKVFIFYHACNTYHALKFLFRS